MLDVVRVGGMVALDGLGRMVALDGWMEENKKSASPKKKAATSKLLAESLSHQLLAFSYRGKRKLYIMNYAL